MPCNAPYARFIFGKFFTSTIILYVLLFAQKVLFLQKKKVSVTLWAQDVMACQTASATTSLREVLKADPFCRQRTLDPKKISVMALNSTRPGCGTSLILYLGAVVMLRCFSIAQSLAARTGASTPKDSTSSASRYIFPSSASLGGGYSSLALSSTSWSFGCYCSSVGES
jgi:hypothetical protein